MVIGCQTWYASGCVAWLQKMVDPADLDLWEAVVAGGHFSQPGSSHASRRIVYQSPKGVVGLGMLSFHM